MSAEPRRVAREFHEHPLRHIRRPMRIPAESPQRRRIHEPQMPPHQFGKRLLRALLGITADQLGIVGHGFGR